MLLKCRTSTRSKPNQLFLLAGSALAGFVSLLHTGNIANAQESVWTNPFGGDFDHVTNWDNGVPVPGVDAIFDLNASYNLNTNGDHAFQSFVQRQGDLTIDGRDRLFALGLASVEHGSLTIDGTGTTLEVTDDVTVGVFAGNNGTLTISDGGLVSNANGYLGLFNGSVGNVAINGSGSQWQNDNLYLGTPNQVNDGGVGHIVIGEGAQLAVGDRPSGFASNDITVEDTGNQGSLVLRNGSTISGSDSLVIAFAQDTTGNVIINGAGSRIDTNQILVGGAGVASVQVQNGGSLTGNTLSVETLNGANGSPSTLTINGPGSNLDVTSEFSIGGFGSGTMHIENGAVASSNTGSIGSSIDGVGTIEVSGNGSQLSVDNLTIGRRGFGTLRIDAGAEVTGNTAELGVEITGSFVSSGLAEVSGAGSQWNLSDDLVVGKDGSGFLRVIDGGTVSASEVMIGTGARNSEASIAGAGSTLVVGHNLSLATGENSTGLLMIEQGAVASAVTTTLGTGINSSGEITVDGAGSRLDHSGDLIVGGAGTGQVWALDGAVITSKNGTLDGGGGVSIEGTGSRWENIGSLTLGQAWTWETNS